MKRRVLLLCLIALGVLGAVGYSGYALTREGMPLRVFYKRMQAPSPYVYDEILPRFAEGNPAALITVREPAALTALRQRLAAAIWGPDGPPTRLPEVMDVTSSAGVPEMGEMPSMALIERLEDTGYEFGFKAVSYHMRPQAWNGETILYHHGYAGQFGQNRNLILALFDAGYAVIGMNYLGYGEYRPDRIEHPRFGRIHIDRDMILEFSENPLRFYVDQAITALNHLQQRHGAAGAKMLGFSAGGWVTTLVAAMDLRIDDSVVAAALYPLYLRQSINFGNEAPPPHLYGPLLRAGNYLEMFIAAAAGEGRSYTQIFNQYDRCCYRNRHGELYAGPVAEALALTGPGRFEVLIDTSHADHKVSNWALEKILERFANEN